MRFRAATKWENIKLLHHKAVAFWNHRASSKYHYGSGEKLAYSL